MATRKLTYDLRTLVLQEKVVGRQDGPGQSFCLSDNQADLICTQLD